MYVDRDGAATKQSQEAYDARVRVLLLTVSVLSAVGSSAAALNGEYTDINWKPELVAWELHVHLWRPYLWLFVCVNSLMLFGKDGPVAVYRSGLASSLVSALLAFSCLSASSFGGAHPSSLVRLQMYCAILLSLSQVMIPRRPELFTEDGRAVDFEDSASALCRYSMNWCNAALVLAAKSGTLEALPVLNYDTRSASQPLIKISSSEAYVWNRIFMERFRGLAKQWTLMLLRSVIALGSPYCILRLLRCLEEPEQRPKEAWMWLMCIGASTIFYGIINHQLIWVQWSEMGIPVKAQLVMSVFQKILRGKDSKEQKKSSSSASTNAPDAINLVLSDANLLAKFTSVNYLIGSTILKLISTAFFLFDLLGWQSCLVAIATTMLCLSVQTVTVKRLHAARKILEASRGRTTGVMKEALYALREIKFSSLEAPWEAHINAVRDDELKHLYRTHTATTLRRVWGTTTPFLIATASISTYLYMGGHATPSIVFPMVTVLPQLQETLRQTPLVLLDYYVSITTSRRLDRYLASPEQENVLEPSPDGQVLFQNATISWPSNETRQSGVTSGKPDVAAAQRFSLHDLNLTFPTGELSIISGRTGAGKSLLLAAILGEVDLLDGHIQAPSIADNLPVAYVSQTPWLQSTTIKDNILFGHIFNKKRYNAVLAACALLPDLATMADGDQTQIGLKGVKLSGGQRARLAFARALYSPAQLLVIDDIFSALDTHVSNAILNALTGNLCKGRSRILVTHHVSLCLPSARYLVHIENNTIAYAGSPESANGIEQITPKDFVELEVMTEDDDNKSSVNSKKPGERPKDENSRSDLSLYRRFFSAAGGFSFVFFWIAGLVITGLLDALASYLLGRVRSDDDDARQPKPTSSLIPVVSYTRNLQHNLQLYLGTSILLIAVECVSSQYAQLGSLRASRFLFRQMTFRVLHMPLQWLDATPFGQTFRNFTMDARSVDDWALVIMSDCANGFVKLTTIICIGIYSSRYTGILTLILLLWCSKISIMYVKARAAVKRVDGGPVTDILEHITSTAAGLATIRAFGATGQFIDKMHHHVDMESTARRHFWIFNRWLGFQLACIGIAFNMGTGVLILSSKSIVDTTRIGFSLTFCMGLSRAIFEAVNEFAHLETYMDALAAVLEYTTLETEDMGGDDVPADWPCKGEVDVEDLQVAYAPSLPLVLKSISFHVGAGQRIGIVGRTGAGKSSLTLSLLRLLEPRSGLIQIDGIDISTVKLADLRSRIAFIPQDPTLFSGTVRSNLDYFQKVPVCELEDALRQVKLLSEDSHSNKNSGLFTLESHISAGGTNMSQGQRQLLCLARTLIKRPKIIILDEATSAVDNNTDTLIQEVIRKRFTGTLIVVAHRLRTIATFDWTMVISEGFVGEQGTPKELLNRRGSFYELVRDSQDKVFLEETISGT